MDEVHAGGSLAGNVPARTSSIASAVDVVASVASIVISFSYLAEVTCASCSVRTPRINRLRLSRATSSRTRVQECQLLSTCAERGNRFKPESAGFGVRTFVVTHIDSCTRSKPPFVRDHGVVPDGQTSAEISRRVGAEARAEHRVRIHVTPTISRGMRVPTMTVSRTLPAPDAMVQSCDGPPAAWPHPTQFDSERPNGSGWMERAVPIAPASAQPL